MLNFLAASIYIFQQQLPILIKRIGGLGQFQILGAMQDLLQDMAIKGQTSMPTKLACQVARNLACALAWLHSKGILHRDVKSSNVLIDIDAKQSPDGGPIVKLCDFDRAVPLSSSAVHTCYLAHRGVPAADVCVGTPRWIAPEVLRAMYGRHPYGFVRLTTSHLSWCYVFLLFMWSLYALEKSVSKCVFG